MNYEEMIRAAIAGGANSEDIAKGFTEALNRIQKESDTASARRDRMEEIGDHFIRCVEKTGFEAENIGELAVLIYAPQHPEWTAEDINRHMMAVNESARMSARFTGVQDKQEVLSIFEDEIDKAIDSAIEEAFTKKPTNVDSSRKGSITKSDEDAILEFLSKLK